MELASKGDATGSFWERFRKLGVGVILVFATLVTGCLGQDFLDAPLELDSFDHGWVANVEPAEEFSVGLVANPLYPGVAWRLADFDDAVVSSLGSEHVTDACTPTEENPCPPDNELGPFLPVTRFGFVGGSPGESPLTFELEVNGRVVDVCSYTIAVVDDACEGDIGIAANRCGLGDRGPDLEVAVYEHGGKMSVEPGDDFTVTLAASAMHPEAPWQVADIDPAVLELHTTTQDPARNVGDWDTSDPDKPWHFVPISRLTFEAIELGESPLVLEIVADGERIDLFEIAVSVIPEAAGE